MPVQGPERFHGAHKMTWQILTRSARAFQISSWNGEDVSNISRMTYTGRRHSYHGIASPTTERQNLGKPREKILRASKQGYHRRSKSPTFKLLVRASERLQTLANEKTREFTDDYGRLALDDSNDHRRDYYTQYSNTDDYDKNGRSKCSSHDPYSGDGYDSVNHVSHTSISLTSPRPRLGVSFDRPQAHLHFFLPDISAVVDGEDNSKDNSTFPNICDRVESSSGETCDSDDNKSSHGSFDQNTDVGESRRAEAYNKPKSVRFPKLELDSRHRKRTKSKRKTKSLKESNYFSNTNDKFSDQCGRLNNIIEERPMDILNDVQTLLSEKDDVPRCVVDTINFSVIATTSRM